MAFLLHTYLYVPWRRGRQIARRAKFAGVCKSFTDEAVMRFGETRRGRHGKRAAGATTGRGRQRSQAIRARQATMEGAPGMASMVALRLCRGA